MGLLLIKFYYCYISFGKPRGNFNYYILKPGFEQDFHNRHWNY